MTLHNHRQSYQSGKSNEHLFNVLFLKTMINIVYFWIRCLQCDVINLTQLVYFLSNDTLDFHLNTMVAWWPMKIGVIGLPHLGGYYSDA